MGKKRNVWDMGINVAGLKRMVRDLDGDGVPNRLDCRPLNPFRQDDNGNGEEELSEEDIERLKQMEQQRKQPEPVEGERSTVFTKREKYNPSSGQFEQVERKPLLQRRPVESKPLTREEQVEPKRLHPWQTPRGKRFIGGVKKAGKRLDKGPVVR